MQVKKQQLELDMEQKTGSKSVKGYVKDVNFHPTYLTYMQYTSCKMPGWIKDKLESRLLGKILITSDMQMTPRGLMAERTSVWRKTWRKGGFLREGAVLTGTLWVARDSKCFPRVVRDCSQLSSDF